MNISLMENLPTIALFFCWSDALVMHFVSVVINVHKDTMLAKSENNMVTAACVIVNLHDNKWLATCPSDHEPQNIPATEIGLQKFLTF